MGTTAPDATVQAPARQAPVLTLIAASRTLLGDIDPGTSVRARWEAGVQFDPDPCGDISSPFVPDCGPLDVFDPDRPTPVDPYQPIALRVGEKCSVQSLRSRDMRARLERTLLIDQHFQLETEFWRGDLAQANGLTNRFLADPALVVDLTGGSPSPLRYALAALQEAIAGQGGVGGCRPAGRGMIHCTVFTASLWHAWGMLRRENQLLLDAFDNVVVPGVGYDGSSPDGNVDSSGHTAYAYATGIVDTRLGDITYGGIDDNEILTAVNDQVATATRFGAAYWDGCCHVGINVDLCNTACGTAEGS